MMAGTPGNWAKVLINGRDITADSMNINYNHLFQSNRVLPQNVGFDQYAPGVFTPQLSLNGYTRFGQGAITAHNLFAPYGVGCADDVEFNSLIALGNCKSPVAGDAAILNYATLVNFNPPRDHAQIQMYNAGLRGRGKRANLGVLLHDGTASGSTITSAEYDSGAVGAGTTAGALVNLQVYTPTGVQATGTISLTGQPSDNDTFTITIDGLGTTYTFKTSPSAANDVLIGATAAATAKNLFDALIGGVRPGVTPYFAGTNALNLNLVFVSKPSASNVITLTAKATGTAANAWTLAKSGTNLAVSGANFSGGVAGETSSIVVASATSSGGSYTTFATFAINGTGRAADWVEVAPGTTINRWIKATATKSGSSQSIGFAIGFARFYAGQ